MREREATYIAEYASLYIDDVDDFWFYANQILRDRLEEREREREREGSKPKFPLLYTMISSHSPFLVIISVKPIAITITILCRGIALVSSFTEKNVLFFRYSLSNMTHNPFPTVNSRIQYFWWYKKRKWKREKGVSNVKSIYFENWEIYCKRKASEGWQSSFWQENNPLIFISRRVEALFSRNQKTSMAGKEREREGLAFDIVSNNWSHRFIQSYWL